MEKYTILKDINSPKDLKELPVDFLEPLCQELREFIIDSVSKTGGHLASNLGTVELTVALHRVFDTPEDEIVWDVGHQCYAHKILTGRREAFSTLRQENGLSGFPKHKESPHDAFVAGHAGTSISVACGIARGKKLSGDNHHAVAVIGDGAFTNGLAYEALTNTATDNDNLIIILNDNEMSISKNVGAFSRYLTRIRSTSCYFKAKDAVEETLSNIPVLGEPAKRTLQLTKYVAKKMLYDNNFFSDLGFTYFGPVDGHDLEALTDVLERAKAIQQPCLIHIATEKGKGYSYAKSNPSAYHGVSKFDIENGLVGYKPASGFSAEIGKYLTYLAMKDKRICAITAAMKDSTGLSPFASRFSEEGRFFDVGIAEAHAAAFAGGLAAKGLLPVFAVYSSFLQRAYDQVLHDLSIEPQHVLLAIDRAGIVGDDGETHQGLFDVALLSNIPGMTIYSPSTFRELRYSVYQGLYHSDGVVAVRYPRGTEETTLLQYHADKADYKLTSSSRKNLIITYGRMITCAAEAAEQLAQEGEQISVLHLNKIYPLEENLLKAVGCFENILFVEEGIKRGSIGEYVGSWLLENGYHGRYTIQAVDNAFVPQAKQDRALERLGLDTSSIAAFFRK